MLSGFTNALLSIFGDLGYFSIIALMTVESSFIPFPSEVVMIPAGYLAHLGKLNMILIILAGTIGSILGALINYYLAKYLGRIIVYKFVETRIAKILLISKHNVEKSEKLFNKYGNLSTFFGRLIPGVRQLISIPAGLAEMKMRPFLLWTTLGALMWNIFLTVLGYQFGANQARLAQYTGYLKVGGIILLVLLVAYIVYNSHKKRKRKKLASKIQL
jgi:membrane protein DedA with SNARE-associated domain